MSNGQEPSAQLFRAWADAALAVDVPDTARAFSFNIYEHPEAFALEVTGSPAYKADDPSWAPEEVFAHRDSPFEIPRGLVADSWERALAAVVDLVRGYLRSCEPAHRLRRADAVAVGFVDGDLHVLWENGSECREAP